MTTQTLRTFAELGEAIRSRAISGTTKNPEASKLRPKPKGEQDFVDQHPIQITNHPVATSAQFDGGTKNVGDHEKAGDDDQKAGEKNIEQGKSKLPTHPDGSAKQDTSKAATKRFGDLKIIRPIKEEDEEVEEVDESDELTEDVFSELTRIVKRKQNARVKFKNGRTESVDTFTASALIKVHKKLNPKNQKAFEAKMNKDPNSFISAVDFALKQVK